MLRFTLDAKSPFHVRWPRNDAAIIRLAETLLAAEAELPESSRFTELDLVQQRRDVVVAARESATLGEAERSALSGAEQQAFDQAKALMRKIIAGLSYRHLNELLVLERWGVPVVQTQSGPRTRTPRSKLAVLGLLTQYVAQEQALPEAERLTDPPLADVTAALNALQTAMAERQSALAQRGVGVMMRSAEAQALLDLLQLAAAYHVVKTFNGVVDRRLQEFGLQVIER